MPFSEGYVEKTWGDEIAAAEKIEEMMLEDGGLDSDVGYPWGVHNPVTNQTFTADSFLDARSTASRLATRHGGIPMVIMRPAFLVEAKVLTPKIFPVADADMK